MLELGGDAGDLGLVFAARTVSSVVFVLVGGVWADRLPRRAVMLGADAVRAFVQASVAVLLLSGAAEIWHLGLAGFVSGAASAFFIPAAIGLVPDTVGAGAAAAGQRPMALSRNAVDIVGPAVSGLLVATIGPGWVFAVDAASYGASTVTLLALRVAAGAALELRQSFLADLRDGWREVAARTWLWVSLLADSAANVGDGLLLRARTCRSRRASSGVRRTGGRSSRPARSEGRSAAHSRSAGGRGVRSW